MITLFAILISGCPSLAQDNGPVAVEGFGADVPNLMSPRQEIYIGGQPTREGLLRLATLKIKTVLNLRPHEENGARDESLETGRLGIKYVNIPLTINTFTLQKMEDFRCLIKDNQNYPIFIHCKSGNRAIGAWFVYRVLFEDASIPQALLEGKALGLEPAMEPILMEFLRQAKQETPKEICQFQ